MATWTRILSGVACLSLLAPIPPAFTDSPDEVVRLDLGSPQVAPGTSVLLRATLASPGTPLELQLPTGVSVRSAAAGVTCTQNRCQGEQRLLSLRLDVADDAPLGPAEIAAGAVRATFTVSGTAKPQLRLDVEPDGPVRAGEKARFSARLTNLAGSTVRRVRVDKVLPRAVRTVRGTGPGWTCQARTCRYRPPIKVGEISAPLTLTAKVLNRPDLPVLPGASRTAGRIGDMRWTSTLQAGSVVDRFGNSVGVQLRDGRAPVVPKPKVEVTDWTTHAHLDAAIHAVTPLRPRGVGRLRVDVLHNRVSHTRGTTRLRIDLPRGVTASARQDGAWRCSGTRPVRCRLDRVIRAKRPAPPVLLEVRAGRIIQRPAAARATVRWSTRAGRHTDVERTRCPVLRPLRVSAFTTHRVLPSATKAHPMTMQLNARIKGTDQRMRASYRWRQLRGPKVRWLTPTAQAHSQPNVAARVRLSSVSKRRDLTFEIAARADGVTVRDRISVTVRPRRIAVMRPKLSGSPNANGLPARRSYRGHPAPRVARLAIQGPQLVRPGRTFTLTAPAAASQVQWHVIRGPRSALTRQGQQATVVAPSKPGMLVIGARLTVDGKRITRGITVRVDEDAPRPASLAATSGFCRVFTQNPVSLTLAGGSIRTGQVTRTGQNCRSGQAALSFSQAVVTLGAHRFTGVNGSLTASGLTITGGTYDPPAGWGKATFPFRTPGSSAVTAPWSGVRLGPLAGSVTMSEFLFLALPAGWNGTTVLSFTPGQASPLQLTAQASGSPVGSAQLTAEVNTNGTFSAQVVAADVAQFTGADGSQATLSGGGTIAQRTPSSPLAYSVTASMDGSVQLVEDLTLSDLTAQLLRSGISLAGTVAIEADGQAVPLAVSGSYRSAAVWSMSANQTTAWVSPDLTITGLRGRLSSSTSNVAFTVTGQASGLQLPDVISVSALTAQVSNTCPPRSASCQTGAVRLLVGITGTVSLGTSPTPFSGRSTVDLSTMSVDLDVQVGPMTLGGLPLTAVTLRMGSDAPKQSCARGAEDPVVVTATVADFLGDDSVAVIGAISSSGVCLSGDLTDFQPTGTSADASFTDMSMVYASYATSIVVAGRGKPVAVAANTIAVYGGFAVPRNVGSALGGLDGTGTFQAVVTSQNGGLGLTGAVAFTLAQPLYLVGSSASTGSSLTLSHVALTVDLAGSSLTVGLQADGDYFTPATSGGSSKATTMPLAVAVDVDLGAATLQFSATAAGSKPVVDAFGQTGLTLDKLVIAGSIGAQDSLGFSSQAELPPAWVSSVGVEPDTATSLVIDISDTPCLQFSIGKPNQTVEAINVLNEGVLIADYANVVLAPLGCQFADVAISPGFALDFDGLIAGDPFAFNAELGLGSAGFSVDASIAIGTMQIGSMNLLDSTFALDLDPASNVFDISFGSTVVVGNSNLQVAGAYAENGSAITASFQAVSQGDIDILGFAFDNADVTFSYTASSTGSTLAFSLSGYVAFLDQSLDGRLALTAQNGQVQTASGAFEVSVNLLEIVAVAGNLQFSYAAGQGAAGTFTNGTVEVFDLVTFTQVNGSLAADGAYQVSGYTPIGWQDASAADADLDTNEPGYFTTGFSGTLGVSITGGNGADLSVDYSNSTVNVFSEWASGLFSSYGSWVPIPNPGCAPTAVTPGSPFNEPVATFWLDPAATENASSDSTGNGGSTSCQQYSSLVYL